MTADKDNTNQTSSKNMDGAQEGSAGFSVEENRMLPALMISDNGTQLVGAE